MPSNVVTLKNSSRLHILRINAQTRMKEAPSGKFSDWSEEAADGFAFPTQSLDLPVSDCARVAVTPRPVDPDVTAATSLDITNSTTRQLRLEVQERPAAEGKRAAPQPWIRIGQPIFLGAGRDHGVFLQAGQRLTVSPT